MNIEQALMSDMPIGITVSRVVRGNIWTAAELSDGSVGIAMRESTATRPRMFESLVGLPAREAAGALGSWNLEEASDAMSVINAWHNNANRLRGVGEQYDYLDPCTRGMAIAGKTISLVGHLSLSPETLQGAAQVFILERKPQDGDFPETACVELLPKSDLVIITGSAFVNKTIGHLLELSSKAPHVVVIGPSVPMCPLLMNAGITRLCGMAVTQKERVFESIMQDRVSGYQYGNGWMISRSA